MSKLFVLCILPPLLYKLCTLLIIHLLNNKQVFGLIEMESISF
jgi:hypothetical protein